VSSSLLSNNLKIQKFRNIILPVVLYGCETWSLALEGVEGVENRVLRICGPKRDEVKKGGKNFMRSFMICTAHAIFFA
jgi:hypothetical protein